MTLEALRARSRKSLAILARRRGIDRWHSMTKDELARALMRIARSKAVAAAPRNGSTRSSGTRAASRGRRNGTAPRLRVKLDGGVRGARSRDLCTTEIEDQFPRGRTNYIDATVCDVHWLRAEWDLTRDSIRRAETRLGVHWHRAVPILRLLELVTDESGTTSERFVKDVPIEAGVNTWYVNVPGARTFRLHIGYRTEAGNFFAVAKSNPCTIPALNVDRPAAREGDEEGPNSANHQGRRNRESADKSDARLGRPLGFSSLSHFGPAATAERESGEFCFKLDTELIIHGSTRPGSTLAVHGDPVELRDDGSFTIRVNQPEGRQVIALMAMSPTGSERRMIVLATERNTKELERQYFDGGNPEGFSE